MSKTQREPACGGIGALVGHDIEVRLGGNSTPLRGHLLDVDTRAGTLTIERHSDGRRRAVVSLSAVAAVLDETRAV